MADGTRAWVAVFALDARARRRPRGRGRRARRPSPWLAVVGAACPRRAGLQGRVGGVPRRHGRARSRTTSGSFTTTSSRASRSCSSSPGRPGGWPAPTAAASSTRSSARAWRSSSCSWPPPPCTTTRRWVRTSCRGTSGSSGSRSSSSTCCAAACPRRGWPAPSSPRARWRRPVAWSTYFVAGDGRVGGPLEDPNDLAFFLLAALPFALALRVAARRRWVYDLASLVLLLALAGTLSRGGCGRAPGGGAVRRGAAPGAAGGRRRARPGRPRRSRPGRGRGPGAGRGQPVQQELRRRPERRRPARALADRRRDDRAQPAPRARAGGLPDQLRASTPRAPRSTSPAGSTSPTTCTSRPRARPASSAWVRSSRSSAAVWSVRSGAGATTAPRWRRRRRSALVGAGGGGVLPDRAVLPADLAAGRPGRGDVADRGRPRLARTDDGPGGRRPSPPRRPRHEGRAAAHPDRGRARGPCGRRRRGAGRARPRQPRRRARARGRPSGVRSAGRDLARAAHGGQDGPARRPGRRTPAARARARRAAPAGPPGRAPGPGLAPGLRRTGVVYTLHGVADGLSDLVRRQRAGGAEAAARPARTT